MACFYLPTITMVLFAFTVRIEADIFFLYSLFASSFSRYNRHFLQCHVSQRLKIPKVKGSNWRYIVKLVVNVILILLIVELEIVGVTYNPTHPYHVYEMGWMVLIEF